MRASLPPPNIPLVGKDGLINPDWYDGINSILLRTGGTAQDLVGGAIAVTGAGIVVVPASGDSAAITRSIATGTGLSVSNGNGVSGNPTISLANTAVTPASYGDATHVPAYTVDAQGRLTAASSVPITFPSTVATATALATARAIYGNNFDGTAALTQIIASTYGGTGNGFAKFSGPASTEKTFTLPNASSVILTDNAAVTVAQGGTGAATLASNGVLYGNGTSAVQVLAVNSTATKKYLQQLSSGAPSWQQVAAADVSGLAASATTDTTSASNISSGTLPAGRLPLPAVAALGGVFSKASVSHQFLTSISSVDGSVGQAQPAFTDISGSVAASQLPNPSSSTLGGVQSAASVSHQWINSISTAGVPALSQPAFSDISGTAAAAQLPVATGAAFGAVKPDGSSITISAGVLSATATAPAVPTQQKFTSSTGTYTLPANCRQIRVRMIGGGGGGGGTGFPGTPTAGGTGGNSTFGTTLLVANGGVGGAVNAAAGGAGGTASLGTGPFGLAVSGGSGSSAIGNGSGSVSACGGSGASTPFGGQGGGGGTTAGSAAGQAGIANTGAGGGGAGINAAAINGACGGGAGGYVDAVITTPSSTYAYAVGAGGTAGAAATAGAAGGVGGAGVIIVDEYY